MLIDFNKYEIVSIDQMYCGKGKIDAKMFVENKEKIILCVIHPGCSIGNHQHLTSDDINYVISGEGIAICDGKEEKLFPSVCHVCKKGSSHKIINNSSEDLVLLTLVIER